MKPMTSREKILERGRKVGLEDMARVMLDQGYGEDYITDQILKRAAEDRGIRPKRDVSGIDDDILVRSLINPAMVYFN